MRIAYFLVSSSAFLFNSIDLGSQSDCSSAESRCGQSNSLQRPHSSVRSSHPAEPISRARSRSPSVTRSSSHIFGFDFEELKFIRLVSKKYPHLEFRIVRYIFPSDEQIHLLLEDNRTVEPIPTEERLVLVTPNGDIVALLDRNDTKLRGIYKLRIDVEKGYEFEERVRINIKSGAIHNMTWTEKHNCPLSRGHPISDYFRVVRVKDSSVSVSNIPYH